MAKLDFVEKGLANKNIDTALICYSISMLAILNFFSPFTGNSFTSLTTERMKVIFQLLK